MGTRLFVAFLLTAVCGSSAVAVHQHLRQETSAVAVHKYLRLRGRQTNGSLPGSKLSGKSVPNDTPLLSVKPLIYIHVPKCGSSFATALAHYGCGDRMQRDVKIKSPAFNWVTCDKKFCSEDDWNRKCPPQKGEPPAFGRFQSAHAPLGPTDDVTKVVMMFREPKARTMSGYFHQLHDCGRMQSKYCHYENRTFIGCKGDLKNDRINPDVVPILEYAKCVGNCATNMLTGQGCSSQDTPDTQAALDIVPSLGFIGLTHEWDLSMCLFHAMFGGPCLAAEFMNLRPGPVSDYGVYFASFEGWTPGDTPVYDKAHAVFWERMHKWGVNRRSCHERICKSPETRKFFQIPSNFLNTSATDDQQDTNFDYDWPGRFFYDED